MPSTGMIVVENTAQWKIMEKKEKQAMSNHSALDFEDQQQTSASEPPWWLMLILLLVFVKGRRAREKIVQI